MHRDAIAACPFCRFACHRALHPIPPYSGPPADAEMEALQRVLDDRAARERHWQREWGRLSRTLPWRTRLRLRVSRRVDGAAIWLAGHGRFRAARITWAAWETARKGIRL